MCYFSVESEEQAEALVDTLHIDGGTLTEANLSGLSSSDLEQLADLEAELCMDSTDIEGNVYITFVLYYIIFISIHLKTLLFSHFIHLLVRASFMYLYLHCTFKFKLLLVACTETI